MYNNGQLPAIMAVDNQNEVVNITYLNGRSGCGGKRSSIIMIACGTEDPGVIQAVLSNFNCTFVIRMSSKWACGIRISGIDPGWYFVIAVIAIAILYLICGIAYKRIKEGATGIEMIPNIDLWRDLPWLVRDGFVWTFVRIRNKVLRRDI